jgi:hypothetical protein
VPNKSYDVGAYKKATKSAVETYFGSYEQIYKNMPVSSLRNKVNCMRLYALFPKNYTVALLKIWVNYVSSSVWLCRHLK